MNYEKISRTVDPWPVSEIPGFVLLVISHKRLMNGGYIETAYCVSEADSEKICALDSNSGGHLTSYLDGGMDFEDALKRIGYEG